MVEHRTPNPGVGGSNPSRPAIFDGLESTLMINKIISFVISVRQEMSKVSWPTFPELKSSTYVVIVVSIIIAMYIFFVDVGLTYIVQSFF